MSRKYIIGVVGNPNCGKTTLFNTLTGSRQRVGNWPGVTVERKIGRYTFEGVEFELVDLPGTYSLDVSEGEVSLDEQIARDYVAAREADLIVNIVDASNLERNLYLTAQLIEMRVPMLVALNMMDVAGEHGLSIDVAGLAERLGCPVMPVIATSGEGITELRSAIHDTARIPQPALAPIVYAAALESAITELLPHIQDQAEAKRVDPRWLAVRLLEGDTFAEQVAGSEAGAGLQDLRDRTEKALGDDIDISVADARYGFVNQVTTATVVRKRRVARSISDRIDRIVLNRALGIPIFLAAMYLMFLFTINIGGAFIDFFDIFTGTLLVEGIGNWLAALGTPDWAILVLADGLGGGVQVVATFIPIIAFLYLFLSVLEDSGYMARAAFVMDRAMRAIGLPGKAFVPLIVGFGCTVPAIMATRTLEQERDRLMTIVMAPFMSCGARLPVYVLFAAAFFPVGGQNIVFGLYLIGIAVAVLTGLIMKNTLLRGQTAPFVMELPPYHVPTVRGILLRSWERTRSFMFRAGKVIVPMVLVLNVLNAVGTDGSFGNEDSDKSVLSEIGRGITPAFAPMGMTEDNWPAAVGLFTGILAKEAVVGTLDALYRDLAVADAAAAGFEAEESAPFSLVDGIAEAFVSIPVNLLDALGTWGDPLGLDVGDLSDTEGVAAEQGVASGTFGAMAARFDGAAGAFAYLLLILLYFPCTAALAAVYRETNLRWTLFVAGWTTGIGYIVATVFYQSAIFARSPLTSAAWIAAMLGAFLAVTLILRARGSVADRYARAARQQA